MRKQIDGSTKYETVRQIEAGKISIRHAAEQLGVHPSSVQAWVRLYKTEGISGFAKQKNQVYSEALKMKVVEAYLSGKGSLAAFARNTRLEYEYNSKTGSRCIMLMETSTPERDREAEAT